MPDDLTIEKLLSPMFANDIPDGLPIALLTPLRIVLVSVVAELYVYVVPSIVIEYGEEVVELPTPWTTV